MEQSHPPQDLLKSGMGSDPVKLRIWKDPDVHGPFRVRLLEPAQCLFPLTETLVDDGEVFGWNVSLLRQGLHLSQYPLPLISSTCYTQAVPQIHQLQHAGRLLCRILPKNSH